MRVSIDGHPLPLENSVSQPVFAADLTGAEWALRAEVSTGAVVLVLTAPDSTYITGKVASVRITAAGSGYTAVPTVTFQAPPAGGATAAGTAAGPGEVASVSIADGGGGYTSAPAVTFSGGGGGSGAAGVPTMTGDSVVSVTVTEPGNGYTSTPTVTFPAAGAAARPAPRCGNREWRQ